MPKFLHDFIVGIDAGSEFSYVAMLSPNSNQIQKLFKINHNPAGFQYLLQIFKKEEEWLNRSPIYFVESTGIYHLPLFFLRSNDLTAYLKTRTQHIYNYSIGFFRFGRFCLNLPNPTDSDKIVHTILADSCVSTPPYP